MGSVVAVTHVSQIAVVWVPSILYVGVLVLMASAEELSA